MYNTALLISVLTLHVLNLFIHLFGCFLILSIFRDGNSNVQITYLLNLSIAEALINLLGILLTPVSLFGAISAETSSVIYQIQYYVMILLETGVLLVYYLCMLYITFDRLMEIILNIRYPVFWNETRAKYLMGITWGICLACGLVVCVCAHVFKKFLEDPFAKYVYPTLDFGFLILACVTYALIFHKFKQSRIPPYQLSEVTECCPKKPSAFHVFRKSHFKVPVFLIASFLFLVVIPDLLYLFIGVIKGDKSPGLIMYSFISILISYTFDGYIYIFQQSRVRDKLRKKMRKWFKLRRGRPSFTTMSFKTTAL